MANSHRGEIEALLDGKPFRLCLTLGALAELEQAFGDTDMLALAERFQSGRLASLDALRLIGAGLRGAGHEIADAEVSRLQGEGGAAGFVDIVARLLTATFGSATAAAAMPNVPNAPPTEGRAAPDPFPGGDVMAAGLGLLRLPPPVFWSMTPKELEAALRGVLGPGHDAQFLSRRALLDLMNRFPDH